MIYPGHCSPPGGGDAWSHPDTFDNNSLQRLGLKDKIVPKAYHSSENLPLEFWDSVRLAQHVSATMAFDSAPAAVDYILRDHISGSFLLLYTNQIDEMTSGNKCDLTRRIAKTVPFWIPPRERVRSTQDYYCLPKLVEDMKARFSLHVLPSLVAGEEVEEVFDWEDANSQGYSSALASDSEQSNSDPTEGAGHLPGLLEEEHRDDGQPQLESFPLSIDLPQTSLAQDIFTTPSLIQMGFQHDFPTATTLSQINVQMSLTRATRCLTPVGPTDDGGRPSGPKVPGEWTGCNPERRRNPSAAGVQGCPFPCFGAGVLAPLRDLPRRFLVPRIFHFSPFQLIADIEERWNQDAKSHYVADR